MMLTVFKDSWDKVIVKHTLKADIIDSQARQGASVRLNSRGKKNIYLVNFVGLSTM